MKKRVIKVRSGLEAKVITKLQTMAEGFKYEEHKIKYQKKVSTYTPDILLENGIFIEVKGYFDAEDRAKHLLIKEQHPDLDIRFLFQTSSKKIHKSSSTTYSTWCDKHGFKYAEREIPLEWLRELGNDAGRKLYQNGKSAGRKTARKNTS